MSNFKSARKYHFIYKTTNLINSKYYIGMHSTNELNDGYLGSGKRLKRSINKYGVENFKCEILEFLPDRTALANREKELVNEDVLKDPNCMNLKEGGEGGFDFVNQNQLNNKANQYKLGGNALATRLRNDTKLLSRYREYGRLQIKRLHELGKVKHDNFKGKHHSIETKQKMSLSSKGKGVGKENSQFGTCWITNGTENKKIKRTDLNNFQENGWKLGRIFL